MAKIKFKLVKFNRRLCFEILEQQPFKDGSQFDASNGLKIIVHSPHIVYVKSHRHVYIRSTNRKENDNSFTTIEFESNEERDLYYNLVINGFKDFSIKGFR